MADVTTDVEVEGSVVAVVHVDNTGTSPVRTVLALASKGDLAVTIEEESADFSPGSDRRTRRYRTNNQITIEVASAMATTLEALELIGIVDSNGEVTFGTADREIDSPDHYIEVAYFSDEPDFATVDMVTDSELLHRFEDLELANPEVDPSETPPLASWVWWVEGSMWFDAPAL